MVLKTTPVFLKPRVRARPTFRSPEWKLGLFGPLVVALAAFLTRLVRLGSIKTLVFDETYYVKDALGLVTKGYEVQWPKDYDDIFVSGQFTTPTSGSFVVHPSVGKALIGWGMQLLGNNPWGWRIAACIAGSVAIFLLGRIVWHLFGNGKMATIAALLLSLDGVQIVLSRTSILDIFLEMFVLLGVLFFVRDQLSYRPKLLAALEKKRREREHRDDSLREESPAVAQSQVAKDLPGDNHPASAPPTDKTVGDDKTPSGSVIVAENEGAIEKANHRGAAEEGKTNRESSRQRPLGVMGPVIWWRPWLFAAGIAWGLATGVKWSGIYLIAVFGIFAFIRELTARWATEPHWIASGIFAGGFPAFLNLVPISGIVYVFSWISWFVHPQAWGHTPKGNLLSDWIAYHQQILNFHTHLTSDHPYKANPWGWLVQMRPTSFYFETVAGNCGKEDCIESVTSLGNPLLWWLGLVALLLVVVAAFVFLDWRAALIVAGYFGTYGPWLIYSDRTIFTFYTVVISPFVVLSLTYVLGVMMGEWTVGKETANSSLRALVPGPFRSSKALIISALVLVVAIFAVAVFFFPVWTALPMPRSHFYWRMWLPSWI